MRSVGAGVRSVGLMSVWGHAEVFITKDPDQRVWIVSTATQPPQQLVIIPWVDAFRGIKREAAPDYFEALATCQSSPVTSLTQTEEDEVMAELAGIVAKKREDAEPAPAPKVVSLADWKRR